MRECDAITKLLGLCYIALVYLDVGLNQGGLDLLMPHTNSNNENYFTERVSGVNNVPVLKIVILFNFWKLQV
jgi:hypothetical protein